MKTTLIVLTIVFILLNVIIARINSSKEKSGYSSDFDFFWLRNCLVFREMEMLFFAIATLTSFFLVIDTGWGPVVWGCLSLIGFIPNSYISRSHWDWYKNHCWKSEKKHYLNAFIVSILSNLIWLFISIVVLTRFTMFILEAQPWNR